MNSHSLAVIILIFCVICWLLIRRTKVFGQPTMVKALPKNAPTGCRISRWTETVLYLCITGTVFVFTATNSSTGGYLLRLDQLGATFARANLIAALVVGCLLFVCMLVCYLGRTIDSTIGASVIIIAYATLLNGPGHPLEAFVSEKGRERKVTWTIHIGGCDVNDAELWVNGVRLGPLPYTTIPEAFRDKVPYWEEPPEEMVNKTDRLKTPRYEPWGLSGVGSSWSQWVELEMPGEWAKFWGRDRSYGKNRELIYYARINWQDQWGYTRGAGTGGGGGRYICYANSHISGVRFPEREARLEALFDRVRLMDYQPDETWFKTAETFGADAVIALRKRLTHESDMKQVLQQWASWKYDLHAVHDASSAETVFEFICQEADRKQMYSTASVAGAALEQLIPHLDPERLARKAIRIIRSTRRIGWFSWHLDGAFHFGYSVDPRGLHTGSDRNMTEWRGGGGYQLPAHGYVVAHALWKMDAWLDEKHHDAYNVIEERVVPEFLMQHHRDFYLLRLAAPIGSEKMGRFLLRKNWRASSESLPHREQMHLRGTGENGWLYLLSILRSPSGDTFRQQYGERIMDMADQLMENVRPDRAEELDFIFMDLDNGTKSLAYRYWPRFKQLSLNEPHFSLELQYSYLALMEPVTTPEMYVETFREYRGDFIGAQQAFNELTDLPTGKKERVWTALRRAIDEDVTHLVAESRMRESQIRGFLFGYLDSQIPPRIMAQHIIEDLLSTKPRATIESIQTWLSNAEPDHPLMEILVKESDPNLRVSVLEVIKAHPSPTNRTLLSQLLTDENEHVRERAQAVSHELEQWANSPYINARGKKQQH